MAFNANITPTVDGLFTIRDSADELSDATKDNAKAVQDAWDFYTKFSDWRRSNKSADMLEQNDKDAEADQEAEDARNKKLEGLKAERERLAKELEGLKARLEYPSTEQIAENMENMPDDERDRYLMLNGLKNPMLTDRLPKDEEPEFVFNWAK